MISRRDKLLLRPWEQRRYEYHRRQVQSASPAIDVGPPAYRVHVEYKRKKHQKELERCSKIEKDNCKLLQRLSRLMSTSRVDNTWSTAQPNFLNRVSLYKTGNKSAKLKDPTSCSGNEIMEEKTRKERCSACTPKQNQQTKVPEERIPWDPPKLSMSRRRSQSLPPRKVQILDPVTPAKSRKASLAKTPEETPTQSAAKKPARSRSSRSVGRSNKNRRITDEQGQSIIFSRGDIRLAISFPVDTEVKLKDGVSEKIITDGLCQCKALKI